jgi:hypothetical protein
VVVAHLANDGVAGKKIDATVNAEDPKNANFRKVAKRSPKRVCAVTTFTVAPHVKQTVSSFFKVELQSRQRVIGSSSVCRNCVDKPSSVHPRLRPGGVLRLYICQELLPDGHGSVLALLLLQTLTGYGLPTET